MRRLTHEFVKEQFEKRGYELLSKSYVGNRKKLKYKCANGHTREITHRDFQAGRGCRTCSIEIRASKTKLDFNIIRKAFIKEGYKLLATKDEYRNVDQKLEFICPNGHTHSMSYHNWKGGWRCTHCHHAKISKKLLKPYSFIKSEFEKNGYKLLSKKYMGAFKKLDYICSEGHRGSIKWNNFSNGRRCIICRNINNSGPNNPNWRGGISCEPYCDAWADKEFKEDIKARDNYECQNPNCWKTSKTLCIHHINYDKKNCHTFNLITLCRSCNSRANGNREWHKEFYGNIMKNKYKIMEV